MPNIARKFVSGVGFSNGCALLALKKPPPLVPNCLMISCDAAGPCAMTCLAPSTVVHGVVRLQVLHHALRHQEQRADDGDRQQDPERRAHQIDPEVADRVLFLLRDAADEGDRHRDAGGRRHEVVVREPGHLREIAHRRFAAVRLPVGVRRERHRRVEGQIRRDAAEALRVEGQHRLQPLHRVEHQQRHDAEQQQRRRVLGPAHPRVSSTPVSR